MLERIQGGRGYTFRDPQPLELLNSLSVAKKILEISESPTPACENAVITSLSLDVVRLEGQAFSGGSFDSLKLTYPDRPGFSKIVDHCAAQVGSQAKRHRRYLEEADGSVSCREQVPKNYDAIVEQIVHHLGPEFLDKASGEIYEYKFIGGDGGLNSALDTSKIPIEEHAFQIDDYLLAVAAHQAVALKRHRWGQEAAQVDGQRKSFGPRLTKKEVIDYILQSNFSERFVGRLCYQLPTGTEETLRKVPAEEEELTLWVDTILERKKKAASKKLPVIGVLDTLIQAAEHRRDSVQELKQGPKPIPPGFEVVCGEFASRHYLMVDDLFWLLMTPDQFNRKCSVYQAAHFSKENISVLWLNDFSHDGDKVRLAVNRKTGGFYLVGLESYREPVFNQDGELAGHLEFWKFNPSRSVSGRLCPSREKLGLNINSVASESLANFKVKIWKHFLSLSNISPEIIPSGSESHLDVAGNDITESAKFQGQTLGMRTNALTGRREYWINDELDVPYDPTDDHLKNVS